MRSSVPGSTTLGVVVEVLVEQRHAFEQRRSPGATRAAVGIRAANLLRRGHARSSVPTSSEARLRADEAAHAMAAGLRARGLRRRRRAARSPTAARERSTRCSRRAGDRGARRASPDRSAIRSTPSGACCPVASRSIEMARASGLALVARPQRSAAREHARDRRADRGARARRVSSASIVAVGGSATTDGGLAAVEALGWSLQGIDVTVACDVETPFLDAARVYGPQKGATAAQVALLTRRLDKLAEQYRDAHRCRRHDARRRRRGRRARRRARRDRRASSCPASTRGRGGRARGRVRRRRCSW